MSNFPTKILLAADGSEEAALAAQAATYIAEKTSSKLHVVLVGFRRITLAYRANRNHRHFRSRSGGAY